MDLFSCVFVVKLTSLKLRQYAYCCISTAEPYALLTALQKIDLAGKCLMLTDSLSVVHAVGNPNKDCPLVLAIQHTFSTQRSDIMKELFRGVPQYLRANSGTVT
jgi:hypothetical protein